MRPVTPSILFLWALLFTTTLAARGQSPDSTEWSYTITAIHLPENLKTDPEYILRELTFAVGDVVTVDEMVNSAGQSRINLLNTTLFINHQIKITWTKVTRSEIEVYLFLRERWYFWPEPVLENAERNFNTWLEETDFRKLNYGVNLILDNVRGNRERLTTVLRFGHDEKYEITWTDPYFRNSKRFGLSFGVGFTGNHEIPVAVQENRLSLFRAERYIFQRHYGFARWLYRPSIHHYHTLSLELSRITVHDTLPKIHPNWLSDQSGVSVLGEISYFLKLDYRDHRAYPLDGIYGDLLIGLEGLSDDATNHHPFIASKANFRWFKPLGKRMYYATGFAGYLRTGDQLPFYHQKGLGYGRHFVRGYEYYVMHGHGYGLWKQNLKYALIAEKGIILPFMPHEKFRHASWALYLNLFVDIGYVHNRHPANNTLLNKWLPASGLGLDLVTYYDKVMRIEGSVNRMGEIGIYLHFIAPI